MAKKSPSAGTKKRPAKTTVKTPSARANTKPRGAASEKVLDPDIADGTAILKIAG